MKTYEVRCEISGPSAMWTRPDTGDAPLSYPAPTFSAAKGLFESIVWLKSAELVPRNAGYALRASNSNRKSKTGHPSVGIV
jgi:CRISPR-associated Cas5-like protein